VRILYGPDKPIAPEGASFVLARRFRENVTLRRSHRIDYAGAALLTVSLANCGQAFFFPLELEFKEGTSWLHVLTMQNSSLLSAVAYPSIVD